MAGIRHDPDRWSGITQTGGLGRHQKKPNDFNARSGWSGWAGLFRANCYGSGERARERYVPTQPGALSGRRPGASTSLVFLFSLHTKIKVTQTTQTTQTGRDPDCTFAVWVTCAYPDHPDRITRTACKTARHDQPTGKTSVRDEAPLAGRRLTIADLRPITQFPGTRSRSRSLRKKILDAYCPTFYMAPSDGWRPTCLASGS